MLGGKRDAAGEDVIGLPSKRNVLNGDETTHEEAGGEKENDGQGDFENDDGIAQAGFGDCAAGALPRRAQSVLNVNAGGLKSREKTEDDDGCDGQGYAEEQDPAVHFNDGFGGNGKGR